MPKKSFTDRQITHKWILGEKMGLFPYLSTDEHGAYGKARLTVFRSDEEWVTLFEILSYIGEADRFANRIYCYGNKIERNYYSTELFTLQFSPDESNLDDDTLNPFDFIIEFERTKYHFTPSQSDYDQAKIDIHESISGDDEFDKRVRVLRLLVTLLEPRKLFFSLQRQLEIIERPVTLPLFLQLNEWHHPDSSKGENVEHTDCLQSLATAISNNVPELYRCPESSFNTNWSQWPKYLSYEKR